jgi:hypothetical protein
VDSCVDHVDYYSEARVQEREAHLSAKYGHLKAASEERKRERERIAEVNRRSKERPDGDAQVITVAVDEVPRRRSNEC